MFQKRINRHMRKVGQLPMTACLSILIACGAVNAQEPNAAPRYSFEQPSQSMAESLRSIARVTGKSVLFESGFVAGKTARPVNGQMSALEAVRAALEGSDLTAQLVADGTILVRPAVATEPGRPSSQGVRSETAPIRMDVRSGSQEGAGQRGSSGSEAGAALGARANQNGIQELDRVEVTGSRLKRIASEGPAPVNVYTRKDIDKSGQPNLERFLSSLNEVSVSTGEGAAGITLGQGTVQLRGLPLGSTLVLINGRRVQAVGSSPGNFFDLNLIPMAAIERVEIVPVGSSAIYGGDALAGVVNIILRKSIEGQSLSARFGSGKGFGDGNISLATGGKSEENSFMLMGTYSHASPLMMGERDFFKGADYRRLGGPDARLQYCTPGTVSSASGGNLPGLNASTAGIPNILGGQPLKVSDFELSAGHPNLCSLLSNGNGLALLHENETVGFHALGEHQFTEKWSIFGEFTFANERVNAKETGVSLSDVLVPASNPFNPFGEAVKVTSFLAPENGYTGVARQTKFTRALMGIRGELPGDWDAEMTISTIRDHGSSQKLNQNSDSVALAAALASTSLTEALNPFASGPAASAEVLRKIWSDAVINTQGSREQLSGLLRGSLGKLPAGQVDAVFGAEITRDRYISSNPEIHSRRQDDAAFAEVRTPLVNAGGPGRSWNLAALTLAARHDGYSDFGSANTYQVGFELRPTRSLLIRATTATSFKPPTLFQTNMPDGSVPLIWAGAVDPSRNGEPIVSGTLLRTTNRDLGPERGHAQGIGAVWEPEGSLGTRLSINHWKIRVSDLIGVLSVQSILDHEGLFPGLVIRGPSVDGMPGQVTTIRQAEVNFGRVNTAGTDLEAAYAWRSEIGRWTASAAATRTDKYRVLLSPNAPEEDRLGHRFSDFWAPKWKGRISLGIDAGRWNIGLTSRYLGGYWDSGASPSRLGDYWVHDMAASFDLKKMNLIGMQRFKMASLEFSVSNLTNRQPQFVQNFPYFYDLTQADWRGRYFSMRVSMDW